MAASYTCGGCNGSGIVPCEPPYEGAICQKCNGQGFIRASGTREPAYDKQSSTVNESWRPRDEG